MNPNGLKTDPFNIIITGVGGQGNVMASRVLGSMFVNNGYYVTIGETFGASQRGGSVMSHLRISKGSSWSPQMPKGRADIIVSLEPIEAIRVLADYSNRETRVLTNTRPIYPVTVIKGEATYPSLEAMKDEVCTILPHTRFIDATEEAIKLDSPILANIIMIGAVCGMALLPLERDDFRKAIVQRVRTDQIDLNMNAFDIGFSLIKR